VINTFCLPGYDQSWLVSTGVFELCRMARILSLDFFYSLCGINSNVRYVGNNPSNQKLLRQCGSTANLNISPNVTHELEITSDQTQNMNTTMATMLRSLLRPITCIGSLVRPVRCHCRYFSPSISRCTDGVYSDLTAMRTRTPFIEAFRKEQECKSSADASTPAHGPAPDKAPSLSPKSMSDSYHRVASHVTSLLCPITDSAVALTARS